MNPHSSASLVLIGMMAVAPSGWAAAAGLPVEPPTRKEPVRFEQEVVPFLAANCAACHNTKVREGGLVLDTAKSILVGGDSGPGVVPGKPAESLLFLRAAHRKDEAMPPADNKVGAKPLSPPQLGLLERWIAEGAAAGPSTSRPPLAWKPRPRGSGPVVAVAITQDGSTTAAARGGFVELFDTPSGVATASLIDPSATTGESAAERGHLDAVSAIAFAPSGDRLATGSFRTIKLWRRRPAERVAEIAGTAAATAVAVSADWATVAIGMPDGKVHLCAAASGTVSRTLAAHAAPVSGLAFSVDAALLHSAARDGVITTTRVADATVVATLARQGEIRAIAAFADGARLAASEGDGVVRIWPLPLPAPAAEAAAPKPLKELVGLPQPATVLVEVPKKPGHLLTAGADGTARLWNADNGQTVRQFAHGGAIAAVAVRPDGGRLATVGGLAGVKHWDVATGKTVAETKADGRLALAARAAELDVAVKKQEVEYMKLQVATAEKDVKAAGEHAKSTEKRVAAAETAFKEKTTAAEGAKKAVETAKAGPGPQAESAAKASQKAEEARTKAETELASAKQEFELVAAQGKEAAEALATRKQAVIDAEKAAAEAEQARVKRDGEALAAGRPFIAASFSRDGAVLACLDAAGRLDLLAIDGRLRGSLDDVRPAAAAGEPRGLAFAADGRLVAVGGSGPATIWATGESWSLERTIGGEKLPQVDDAPTGPPVAAVTTLAFSPDGQLLASGGGRPSRSGEIKLWKVADGSFVRGLDNAHSDTVMDLEFSPRGDLLASGSADRFLRVHSVGDGRPVVSFEGHTGHVLGVGWKANGRYLASGGADGAVKVWNIATGTRAGNEGLFSDGGDRIRAETKEVSAVHFIDDTLDEMVTAAGTPSIRLVNVGSGNAVRTFSNPGDFVEALAVARPYVVVGCYDGKVRIWDLATGAALHTVEPSPASP